MKTHISFMRLQTNNGTQASQQARLRGLPTEDGSSLNHIEDAEYSQTPSRTTTEINMDAAAWSYLRCSFLFLVALVVTWV
jgi:hypothetical protein